MQRVCNGINIYLHGLICPPISIINLMISKVGALSYGSKNNDDDEMQAC
jgi:hypothetical protein